MATSAPQSSPPATQVQRARRSRWLALILLVFGIVLIGLGAKEVPTGSFGTLPEGSDSRAVAEAVAGFEDERSDNTALVVVSAQDKLDIAALQPLAKSLGAPPIPAEDGKAALIFSTIDGGTSTDVADQIDALRAEASDLAPEGTTVEVTGPAAIQADLANVFDGANFMLLGVTALIVAVLLIVTYRSPVLWLIPLTVIAVADRVAATVFTWILSALGMSWDESTAGILSVLVFGAGTNYALLLISRYRDELRGTDDRFAAMASAWKPTAHACTASASTVALGVLCLLLSATPNTRGLGLASTIGVLIALSFALFVLPGALVLFGRWIFWPKTPAVGSAPEHGLWDRIGGFVANKQIPVMVGSIVVLAVACLGALNMNIGLKQQDQFLDTPESIAAMSTLQEHFPNQGATPATVLSDSPAQAAKATEVLKAEGATVRPGPANDEHAVVYASGADTQTLRDALSQADISAKVGGPDAQLYDQAEFAAQDRTKIFPAVLIVVLLALMLLLRSVVAPLIMVATVLATNVAALGIGWWVFTQVLGFNALAESTPLYTFVFLVALGVDYNIFLVTRAKEAAQRHPDQGMVAHVREALSTTGGVITSAGLLLAAVFAALGVLPLVALAQIGVVIFIGVLLDTLIVRTILLPAIMMRLGDRFWWPSKPAQSAE